MVIYQLAKIRFYKEDIDMDKVTVIITISFIKGIISLCKEIFSIDNQILLTYFVSK